jgi:uncharacterized membrane protein YqhA
MTATDEGGEEGHSAPALPGASPGRPDPPLRSVFERLLAGSLLLAIIPVVFLVAAALGAFVYGVVVLVHSVSLVVRSPFPVSNHVGLFLLDIDLFLIGATLLISAVGFYELFIRDTHHDDVPLMPSWLEMTDLNDLKRRIIAMIVMVLSVSFVEVVVDSPSGRQTLELGGGVAAVIVALTVFIRWGGHGNGSP